MEPEPITRGKLTKRFSMSLETGQYIVSNAFDQVDAGGFEPCFREVVAPPDARNEQWARIKATYADGRLCDVLRSEAEYEAYRRSLPAPTGQDRLRMA